MKSTNNVEKSRGKFKGLDQFEIELLESDIEHSETETEEDGNKLSYPTILIEGYDETPMFPSVTETTLTGDYWYYWTWTDADGVVQESWAPELPDMLPDGATVSRVYPQSTDSLWQADYLDGLTTEGLPTWDGYVDYVNFSDGLESLDRQPNKPVRIEVVLGESLVDEGTPLTAYDMQYLEGAKKPIEPGPGDPGPAIDEKGPTESWGIVTTNSDDPTAITYESYDATVYTNTAQLLIQELVDVNDDGLFNVTWDADTQTWIGDEAGTVLLSEPFSAEINQSGTLIYGTSYTFEDEGDYRITVYFDPNLDLFNEATEILAFGEEEEELAVTSDEGGDTGVDLGGGTAYVDADDDIAYIDIHIEDDSGGQGGSGNLSGFKGQGRGGSGDRGRGKDALTGRHDVLVGGHDLAGIDGDNVAQSVELPDLSDNSGGFLENDAVLSSLGIADMVSNCHGSDNYLVEEVSPLAGTAQTASIIS